jgi:fructose-1,6-bisphosphatase
MMLSSYFISCSYDMMAVIEMIKVSEEHDKPIILEEKTGGYAIVFDPLDGSSNIEANVSGNVTIIIPNTHTTTQ